MYLSALFIAQSVLEFREVRMNADTALDLLQDLKKTSSRSQTLIGSWNLVDLILSVTRDPKAFRILLGEYGHTSSYRKEHSEKLRVLQDMNGEFDGLSVPKRSKPASRLAHTRVKHAQSATIVLTTGSLDAGPTDGAINDEAPLFTLPLKLRRMMEHSAQVRKYWFYRA